MKITANLISRIIILNSLRKLLNTKCKFKSVLSYYLDIRKLCPIKTIVNQH